MCGETHSIYRQHCAALYTVIQFVEEHSVTIPDAIAVVGAEGMHLSYGALNKRANQLSHYLQRHGVEPETPVGLYMARSCDLIVVLLAILKAGGAYVPLDPHSPQTRLQRILEDTQTPIVLSDHCWCNHLPLSHAKMICVDADWHIITQESDVLPASRTHPAQLAYIIYTSGSTGMPKGVTISHQGLTNLIEWHQRVYCMTTTERATHVANIAFDASVWEIWSCLSSGATLCLPPDDIGKTPLALRDWLIEQAVTISFLPTPLAEAMLTLPWPPNGSLKTLLTGGDRLQHYPDAKHPFTLVNHYGVTESSVVSTAGVVLAQDTTHDIPSIGAPIHNTHVYILNHHYKAMPSERSGVLFIGGAGLARGYWQQPSRTAACFLSDPFTTTPGGRMYDTRDTGYYQTNGAIRFIGRVDHQVQVRGYRIELGEIEAALILHPAVQTSVVCVDEREGDNQQLVAYLITTIDEAHISRELQQFLQTYLPDYMIPTTYTRVESFPLTPHGKIDRAALSNLVVPDSTEYIAPRTPVEEVVVGLWKDVLSVSRIGVHDTFLHLGGNSLHATQIVARLRQVFQVSLTPRHLLTYPTVEAVVQYMLENEVQVGRIEKIARAVLRLKTMTTLEKQQVLKQKKSYV